MERPIDTLPPVEPSTKASERPAEIRAFLIADVRGYTLFTQERGDEAAAKLAAKFAGVAREGVEQFGGEVIELRGDEALAVFASPRQAIRAAIELQARFVDETEADPSLPLPVGIGLDAGEAVPMEGGWRGGALNLAARLCGQAGPGEILASQEITHLARKVDGVRYMDRGALHLKGMAGPVLAIRVVPEGDDPAVRLARFRQPAPAPRRRSRISEHRVVIAGLAVVLVASVTVAVVLSGGGGPSGSTAIDVNSAAAFDLRTGALTGQTAMNARPGQMAAGGGALWITHTEEGTVSRIDLRTKSIQTIQVGTGPTGVAFGDGAVWVANSQDRTVSRINLDTNSVVKVIPVGNGPTGVAVGDGAVWVTNSLDDTVARIDPASNEVQVTIPVGGTPSAIAVASGAVWVAESTGGRVSHVDPDSNDVVGSTPVGNGPGALAASSDSVWVANSLDGTVSRLDAATGTVVAAITVGAGANAVAVSGADVWVTSEYAARVSRVDARTNANVGKIDVGNAPVGAVIVEGSLWVVASGAPSSHRGGTLRIGSTKPVLPASADPSIHGTESPIWPLVYDTLVGFKRVGGVDGSSLVPDLAVSIPDPTNGGLTYSFKLRPGIRYSDGSPVRAVDVRHSLERAFKLALDASYQLSGIVGAEACGKRPASCDLSEGVVVSGDGTVSVHLSAPDPDFLYKMAAPEAFVIPSDAPDSDIGTHPLPGTGPYMIEELVPGDHVTLVRNPRFLEWSRAAQPDGFPDRIEWTVVADGKAGVDAVEAGDIDVFGTNDEIPRDLLDQVFTQFTRQAHAYAFTGPWAMYLNTQVPPFDDVRVRRALSFAIDRTKAQQRYPGGSAITCQVIPANFGGYQPYCPYTVAPDAAGTWTVPDLAKARALVEASGTKGASVTVWSAKGFAEISEYFASVLNDLGYPAKVKAVDDFGAFYQYIANSKHRAQAGGFWLTGGPPLASDLFNGVGATCDSFQPKDGNNQNIAEFCDHDVDALFAKALALQVSDPAASRSVWSQLDRRITDLAPLIPVVVPEGIDFLSKRVGNYQHNQAYGILLAQVWVT
jgi:YVTN family beta-propeller protein